MRTRTATATIIAAGALVLTVSACGSSDDRSASGGETSSSSSTSAPGASSGSTIVIKDYDFTPKLLTATAGRIAVRNDDGTAHSVTADDATFDTGRFSSGAESIDVTEPGTYAYHCAVHPFMTGSLVVRAR